MTTGLYSALVTKSVDGRALSVAADNSDGRCEPTEADLEGDASSATSVKLQMSEVGRCASCDRSLGTTIPRDAVADVPCGEVCVSESEGEYTPRKPLDRDLSMNNIGLRIMPVLHLQTTAITALSQPDKVSGQRLATSKSDDQSRTNVMFHVYEALPPLVQKEWEVVKGEKICEAQYEERGTKETPQQAIGSMERAYNDVEGSGMCESLYPVLPDLVQGEAASICKNEIGKSAKAPGSLLARLHIDVLPSTDCLKLADTMRERCFDLTPGTRITLAGDQTPPLSNTECVKPQLLEDYGKQRIALSLNTVANDVQKECVIHECSLPDNRSEGIEICLMERKYCGNDEESANDRGSIDAGYIQHPISGENAVDVVPLQDIISGLPELRLNTPDRHLPAVVWQAAGFAYNTYRPHSEAEWCIFGGTTMGSQGDCESSPTRSVEPLSIEAEATECSVCHTNSVTDCGNFRNTSGHWKALSHVNMPGDTIAAGIEPEVNSGREEILQNTTRAPVEDKNSQPFANLLCSSDAQDGEANRHCTPLEVDTHAPFRASAGTTEHVRSRSAHSVGIPIQGSQSRVGEVVAAIKAKCVISDKVPPAHADRGQSYEQSRTIMGALGEIERLLQERVRVRNLATLSSLNFKILGRHEIP
jgi:hypothetical protein